MTTIISKPASPTPRQGAPPRLGEPVDVDAWLREVIAWHFDPQLGAPYWLERATTLDFDPRRDVQTLDDLDLFGPFPEDDLRRTPVRDFIPLAYRSDGRLYACKVMETGGTTGLPKRVVELAWNETVFAPWSSMVMDAHGFEKGGDWLFLLPTGPHAVGRLLPEIIRHRQGLCHKIDLDPRWVKRCVLTGQLQVARDYTDHIVNQALAVVETQDIAFLATTSRLLESLSERIDLRTLNLKGVVSTGTHLTPQTHRRFRELFGPETPFMCGYGNSLILSMACQMPFQPGGDSWDVAYYPCQPYVVLQVRKFENPWQIADYGEWGRINAITLTKDFFLPNFLERDEGMRTRPHPLCPWDGVANARPYTGIQNIAEGLY